MVRKLTRAHCKDLLTEKLVPILTEYLSQRPPMKGWTIFLQLWNSIATLNLRSFFSEDHTTGFSQPTAWRTLYYDWLNIQKACVQKILQWSWLTTMDGWNLYSETTMINETWLQKCWIEKSNLISIMFKQSNTSVGRVLDCFYTSAWIKISLW